jgi:hypothetical protein
MRLPAPIFDAAPVASDGAEPVAEAFASALDEAEAVVDAADEAAEVTAAEAEAEAEAEEAPVVAAEAPGMESETPACWQRLVANSSASVSELMRAGLCGGPQYVRCVKVRRTKGECDKRTLNVGRTADFADLGGKA